MVFKFSSAGNFHWKKKIQKQSFENNRKLSTLNFFYKNQVYKNIEPEKREKNKNILRTISASFFVSIRTFPLIKEPSLFQSKTCL